MTPEGKIQAMIKRRFESLGGLVRKISYEGRRGCPDLIIAIGGRILLVEVKKSIKSKLDPHQEREAERYRSRGVEVFKIGSEEELKSMVAKLGL